MCVPSTGLFQHVPTTNYLLLYYFCQAHKHNTHKTQLSGSQCLHPNKHAVDCVVRGIGRLHTRKSLALELQKVPYTQSSRPLSLHDTHTVHFWGDGIEAWASSFSRFVGLENIFKMDIQKFCSIFQNILETRSQNVVRVILWANSKDTGSVFTCMPTWIIIIIKDKNLNYIVPFERCQNMTQENQFSC